MSSKKRKGQSPWSSCDDCQIIICQKDTTLHKGNCPPHLESWIHPFIQKEELYTNVEAFLTQDKSIQTVPKENRNNFVLLPCHVLQLCKIPIGSPVIVKPQKTNVPFIKLAWMFQKEEKTSDFIVALSNEDMKLGNLQNKDLVVIQTLKDFEIAKHVIVCCENDNTSINAVNLLSKIQTQNTNKIYCSGNKFLIKMLGFQLVFRIIKIVTLGDMVDGFHLIRPETTWEISTNNFEEKKPKNLLEKLGGMDAVISDLQNIMSLCLGPKYTEDGLIHYFKELIISLFPRGILIYGPSGTGKSTLAQGLAEYFTKNIVRIEGPSILSKFLGETEKELKNYFEIAKQMSPSVILIDDLDVLCGNSEHEKRITAALSLLMDKLNEVDTRVMVLATTSKIHKIDKILRCPKRFGKEVEIHVPSSSQRLEILNNLLENINHNLKNIDLINIANSSHGFVGSDLACLISNAIVRRVEIKKNKMYGHLGNSNDEQVEQVTIDDFEWALTKVKPSAMREIIIEVPNVKWSDIGGQEELKLKLKQCVEWPLQYSKSFSKLGITAPKGLLMFGPPGCSKTLIAKALANESKLNFISVKGPELFSKWVGESERAVRKVFRLARQTAPSIIFFDEIDAIGGERNSSSGSNVQERVLAQLLTELDGVEPLNNVTVIAATNRIDRIDPALIRPGRLDRIIYVPLPDSETRKEIFNLQIQKSCVSEDVNINELVENTEGYSGAEIVAVCREAALKALEENLDAEIVTRKHYLAALSIIVPRTPKNLLEMYEKYLMK